MSGFYKQRVPTVGGQHACFSVQLLMHRGASHRADPAGAANKKKDADASAANKAVAAAAKAAEDRDGKELEDRSDVSAILSGCRVW